MDVRLVDGDDALEGDGVQGELQVRGPNVFREYWRRPEETAKSFTPDGWFRTGDQVAREAGSYRIVGRLSTDIIKSGGYKISALEIEGALLAHPDIVECCVVGVPDDVWGERIGAALVMKAGTEPLDLDTLRSWARAELASYKLPTLLRVVDALPRNVMGKIVKPDARQLF
jgi:malonyl-CoA/methylmalonyl-CoA synthetase